MTNTVPHWSVPPIARERLPALLAAMPKAELAHRNFKRSGL